MCVAPSLCEKHNTNMRTMCKDFPRMYSLRRARSVCANRVLLTLAKEKKPQ